jgi:PEP-CTERM motif-containing protein
MRLYKSFAWALPVIFLSALSVLSTAKATTISFDLSQQGYNQDSSVSGNLFEAMGLILSSPTGLVTACGGSCLSATAGSYNGTIFGQFVLPNTTTGASVTSVSFGALTDEATVSFFGVNDALLQTVGAVNGAYAYTGSAAVEYFQANLNYEAFSSVTFGTEHAVPEPATLTLFGAVLVALARLRRRKMN